MKKKVISEIDKMATEKDFEAFRRRLEERNRRSSSQAFAPGHGGIPHSTGTKVQVNIEECPECTNTAGISVNEEIPKDSNYMAPPLNATVILLNANFPDARSDKVY